MNAVQVLEDPEKRSARSAGMRVFYSNKHALITLLEYTLLFYCYNLVLDSVV